MDFLIESLLIEDSDSESSDMTDTVECGAYRQEEDDQPVPLTQAELNDLTRYLTLSKESAQLLGSRLREKRLLAPGTTFYWYQNSINLRPY